jgi:hypothetical protein
VNGRFLGKVVPRQAHLRRSVNGALFLESHLRQVANLISLSLLASIEHVELAIWEFPVERSVPQPALVAKHFGVSWQMLLLL